MKRVIKKGLCIILASVLLAEGCAIEKVYATEANEIEEGQSILL